MNQERWVVKWKGGWNGVGGPCYYAGHHGIAAMWVRSQKNATVFPSKTAARKATDYHSWKVFLRFVKLAKRSK